ncbi:MAG: phosphatidylserine decarboxylase family protein [Saprospiraceae bacterium]|nr:phosphatidylserine decarboxylase family protein [Saprospiraceae bacterium]MDZ4702448.1 phosphatidylserine decarboxylase family protein [Saprospiraceae bacterium]
MSIIHKEGFRIISITAIVLVAITYLLNRILPGSLWYIAGLSGGLFLLMLQFFRNPRRIIPAADDNVVYAPADGKVVVIEETEEPEYFKDRRLQVSIFMSPLNVHVNRNPIGGKIAYLKYHPGKYLVAWHPKSSTENERTTVVIQHGQTAVLLRQIAGAMAKRIRNYLQVGDKVIQGSEMGFITFGSRVDLLLPLDAVIEVQIGQNVKGNLTRIARLKKEEG